MPRPNYELTPYETHWVITVNVGNDWGEPDYTEERSYDTEKEMHEALEHRNYYDTIQQVECRTYFRFDIPLYEDEEYD